MNRKLLIIIIAAIAIGGGAAIYYLSSNSNEPASVDPVPDTPVTPDEPEVLEVDTLRKTLQTGDVFSIHWVGIDEEETEKTMKIVFTAVNGEMATTDVYVDGVLSNPNVSAPTSVEYDYISVYFDYEEAVKTFSADPSVPDASSTVTKETAVMDTEFGKRKVTVETQSYSWTDSDSGEQTQATVKFVYGEGGAMYEYRADIVSPGSTITSQYTILECSLYE